MQILTDIVWAKYGYKADSIEQNRLPVIVYE